MKTIKNIIQKLFYKIVTKQTTKKHYVITKSGKITKLSIQKKKIKITNSIVNYGTLIIERKNNYITVQTELSSIKISMLDIIKLFIQQIEAEQQPFCIFVPNPHANKATRYKLQDVIGYMCQICIIDPKKRANIFMLARNFEKTDLVNDTFISEFRAINPDSWILWQNTTRNQIRFEIYDVIEFHLYGYDVIKSQTKQHSTKWFRTKQKNRATSALFLLLAICLTFDTTSVSNNKYA